MNSIEKVTEALNAFFAAGQSGSSADLADRLHQLLILISTLFQLIGPPL